MMRTMGIAGACLAAALGTFGSSSVAWADGSVTITLSPDGQAYADEVGLDVAELEMELSEAVEGAFALLELEPYLKAFSDAASFSNRGLGADYAITTDGFIIGYGANIALSVGDDTLDGEDDRPVAGVAANMSFLLGANLARWDLPDVTVYGNLFSRGVSVGPLSGDLRSFGLHGQYKLYAPDKSAKRDLVVQWGGIDLTSGIEYSSMSLGLRPADSIETDLPIEGDMGQVDLRMESTGSLDFSTTALTVPFEATTSLRLLYLLSIYGGVGFDVQLGKSSVEGNLSGTIRGNRPDDGSVVDVATAQLQLTESAGPSAGQLRFLLGTQLNLWRLKLFTQLNVLPPRSVSFALGVRIVI